MIDLVQNGNEGYTSLKDVTRRQSISPKYLEQIATSLSKAGLIHSVRGPQGGYKLARAPGNYTVREILRPIEGTFACVACLEEIPNSCPRYDNCSTVHFWEGLHEVMINYLNGTTLADLAIKKQGEPCPSVP